MRATAIDLVANLMAFDEGAIDLTTLAERQERLLSDARATGSLEVVLTLVGDDAPRRAAFKIARDDRERWKSVLARGETPRATPEGLARLDLVRRAGLTILVTKAGYTLSDQERGVHETDWFAR